MNKLVRAKFKVKIKSLATEAVYIRQEEKRIGHSQDGRDRSSLREHRVGVVRLEQRATLLAYAFLRGVPYSVVEGSKSSAIPVDRVRQIVKSLAWESISADDVNNWLLGRKAAA